MHRKLCLILLALMMGASAATLFGQGTVFTYQGLLVVSNNPAHGVFDMTFKVFNAASAGAQVGATTTTNGVAVSNGLFTVRVDPGTVVFTGADRWLEVAVRTNGGATFSNLMPRQALTPNPYANFAGGAATANAALSVAAAGVNAAAISNNAVTLSKLAPGVLNPTNFPPNSVTSSQLADSIALGATNVNGRLEVWSTTAGTPAVSLNGATSQISTYGSDGLEQIRLWGVSYGEITLNNNLPNNATAALLSANGAFGGYLSLYNSNGANRASLSGGNSGGSLSLNNSAGSTAVLLNSAGSSWINGGYVGINTTAPAAALHVNGAYLRVEGGSGEAVALGADGFGSDIELGSFNPGLANVTLYNQGAGDYMNLISRAVWVDWANQNSGGVTSNALAFGSGSGEGIASKRTAGGNQYGLDFYTLFAPRMSILNGGNVGIGTQTPGARLDVFDGTGSLGQGGTIHVGGYGANGDAKLIKFGDGDYVHVGESGADDRLELKGSTLSIIGGTYLNDNMVYLRPVGDSNHGLGYVSSVNGGSIGVDGPFLYGYNGGCLGTAGPESAALVWGWTGNVWISNECSVGTLRIRGGADVAEPFHISGDAIPKGSLVIIDENNAGRLKLSERAYDTRVAGIVSGANGINPGLTLHQEGLVEGGQNVALSGRVYALADATRGAIKPGDLLTSSDTSGHVMKVRHHAKAQGAIVGKAMSALKEGKGTVLVLVTLQ